MQIALRSCGTLGCRIRDGPAVDVPATATLDPRSPPETDSESAASASASRPANAATQEPWLKFYATGNDLVKIFFSNREKPKWYIRVLTDGRERTEVQPILDLETTFFRDAPEEAVQLPPDVEAVIKSTGTLQLSYYYSPKVIYTAVVEVLEHYRQGISGAVEQLYLDFKTQMERPSADLYEEWFGIFNSEGNIIGSEGRLISLRDDLLASTAVTTGFDPGGFDWKSMTRTEASALSKLQFEQLEKDKLIYRGGLGHELLNRLLHRLFWEDYVIAGLRNFIQVRHLKVFLELRAALDDPKIRFANDKPVYDLVLKMKETPTPSA